MQPERRIAAAPRVLLVDDDPVVRTLFTRSLSLGGYDAIAAADGRAGYAVLQSDAAIRLVVLDLIMPGMDGWRFRHLQRQDPQLANIPTVIMTGAPLPQIVDAELSVAAYLFKPVSVEQFLSVVRQHCRPSAPGGDA